jgi:hypothetical protein
MYIKNRNKFKSFFLFLFCIPLLIFSISSETTHFVSSKGLSIGILSSNGIGLVHAEILIFYHGDINPAISYLTVENMFNPELHNSDTNLLGILKRLGNDFKVEHRTDYLKISVDFLSTRISLFTQFVDELFSYKSFSLKRYNNSILNYRKFIMKKNGWEKMLAGRYAYSHLFQGHSLGRTVIDGSSLLKINLAQIRSFYRNTFKPGNAFLFLKGNLNPHITFGMVEKALKSYKKAEKVIIPVEKLTIINNRKIIVLDVVSNEAPIVFWFQAIPVHSDNNHMFWRVMNNILFDYPIGIVYKKATQYGIRNIRKIETDLTIHSQVSVICNTFKINYSDIERFIVLVDNEARKLSKRKIDRKEYLDSLNYFLGQSKVESSRFTHDVQMEVDKSVLKLSEKSLAITPKIFQRITLDNLNQFIGDIKFNTRNGNHIKKSEVIVIAGNARLIKGYFNTLKLDLIHSAY